MNNYKIIPSFPMFEICDTVPMEYAVRNIQTKEYCKALISNSGYPKVYLGKRKGGDGEKHFIHRLVCETYIGNIPDGYECDHIDTNKLNFSHNNIRIVTRTQNLNNPLSRKHMSEAKKKYCSNPENRKKMSEITKNYFSNPENRKKQSELNNFQKKIVLQIDKNTRNIINEHFGLAEAERKTGIFRSSISACCNGKLKTAGGFLWQFK